MEWLCLTWNTPSMDFYRKMADSLWIPLLLTGCRWSKRARIDTVAVGVSGIFAIIYLTRQPIR